MARRWRDQDEFADSDVPYGPRGPLRLGEEDTGTGGREGPRLMAVAAACILWFAVIMYAIFGGADYGAGFWDLSAGGTRRGERPRGLIDHAMAPGVGGQQRLAHLRCDRAAGPRSPPRAGSIMRTLFIPIILAGLGIVVRGAGFAFRKVAERAGRKRVSTAAFGVSSVITPFMLGAALGGIASGRVPPGNKAGDLWSSWLNSTSITVGIFGVLISAFIAATFLVADANRYYDEVMASYFRIRAFVIGLLAGIAAFVGLFVLRDDAPVHLPRPHARGPPLRDRVGRVRARGSGRAVAAVRRPASTCARRRHRALGARRLGRRAVSVRVADDADDRSGRGAQLGALVASWSRSSSSPSR